MGQVFEVALERTPRRVTLILRGQVQHGDAATAVRLCLALPPSVRILEVNARDVCDLSDDACTVLLALVRTWRRVRLGEVCIQASERTVRALGEHVPEAGTTATATPLPASASANAALTAMYL